MLLAAANSAGGQSTLDWLIDAVILVWAVAGALAVLGWLGRRLRRRARWTLAGTDRGMLGWLPRRADPAGILSAVVAGVTSIPRWMSRKREEPPPLAEPATRQAAGGTDTNATAQQGPAAAAPATPPPPATPEARCSPETLELAGLYLDNSRRLAAVEARVAPVLDTLPRDRWLVDRYVLFEDHRIPFLILGETGMFALWATSGPPRWNDIPAMGQTAERLRRLLPGYTGKVQAGICRALEPDVEPRWWCRTGEPGAWVMGLDWVIRWLQHFGPEQGLGAKDIERLRELAGPRWGQGVTDLPASALVPEFDHIVPG